MQRLLARWKACCASSATLRFVDLNLRGAGQVMFQDNPLSGALFLAALCWGSIAAGVSHVPIGGVAALVAATATARWIGADAEGLASGRYGFNGILTGLALAYFLGPGIAVLGYAVLGGVLTAVALLGPFSASRPWRVPENTYPFVIITWILILASDGFRGVPGLALSYDGAAVALDPAVSNPLSIAAFAEGVLHSISQVFFKGDGVSALLLLAGLAVNSPAAAGFALGGAVIAVVTAHLFGVESELITSGLQGFSPVLAAIAFGTVFDRPGLRAAGGAALAVVFTVIAQAALKAALAPLSLPPLSAPFDVAAWVLLRISRR